MTSSITADIAAPACTIVIFGAAGDLTKRLLMPALYDLAVAGLLDASTPVFGIDGADLTDETWRDGLTRSLHELAEESAAEFNAERIRDDKWSGLRGS